MQPKFTRNFWGIFSKISLLVIFSLSLSTGKINAQCSWAASTVYPINVLDQGVATVGSNLYSFCGVSGGAVISNAYRFDGATWTPIANAPATLEFPGVASDGTNVYILGGYNGAALVNTMYRYNVATNNYTTLAPFPAAAWALTVVHLNGKLYRFGGQINLTGTSTNALDIYDIATNTWSVGAPMPQAASFIGGFAIGNFVYAVGGNTGSASAKTYRYDPATNTWDDAAIADLPGVRWGAATANYGGFGIMAGGYDAANPTNTAIIWDPVGNSWSALPNLLADRARMTGAVLGSSFYVIGGRCTTGTCTGFAGSNNNQRLTCNFTPCSGTPNPGATQSSSPGNTVCPTVPFTLSMQNAQGPGSQFQWQSSPDGTNWSDIPSATGATYTTSISTPTWYRVRVVCTNGGLTGFSTPLQMQITPPSSCYCTPTYASGCTFGDFIARVRLVTIDNVSTCSTPPYTYYSAVAPANLVAGLSYQLVVTVGPDTFGQWVGAWIDYNQNGSFNDAGEFLATPINAGANGTATLNFTVPAGATLGTTRLRIRAGDDAAMTAAQSCGPSNSSFGEAEDYNVVIDPCIRGVFNTQPSNASVQCSGNATFQVTSSGTGVVYSWEYRVNSSSLWNTVTNGGVYSGANTNTLILRDVPATMNGYQYRAVIQGPCTPVDVSNVVTLTVTPLIATVSPASATICNGQIQQLTLTNPTSVPVYSPATNLPLNIPDNTPNGVNSTINVSGIPLTASITGVTVTLNMTHTWAGDMVFVLKAPNGQILNLDWYLSGTGGTGATTGFTNTRISSTGTALLSSGSNPWNGIFRADASLTGAPGFPAGPNGFLPTTTNWSALYPTTAAANGDWVLAMYDGGPADLGVLTSWSINIAYTAPPAQGVWSVSPSSPNPSPNTMWTDPGATIPYVAGSLANTIYVNPTANTIYSVIYSTPTPCTSPPTNIPVNVVQPITGVVNPANRSVCVGGNVTFSVTANGGPINYQWQVSTNSGASYTNITGATSATLSLTNVTQSMHNNLYRVVMSAPPCAGTITTPPATLTVNPLPTVLLSANPTAVKPGVTTTILVNSTPAGATYSWTFNGRPLVGVTGSSYVANVDGIGTYTVTVTDVNGCVNTSSAFRITGQQDSRLFIYPNPAPDGMFQVRLYSGINFDYRKVNIYNAAGARVAHREFPTSGPWEKMEFNLSNQASGVYMVEVVDRYDTKLASGKVVIQR